jgi:hypothetical protein
VFISFGIYQATTETFKLRDVLSTEGNFYTEIRLSMSILDRDLSQAFNPITLIPPKGNPQDEATEKTKLQQLLNGTDFNQTTTFWEPAAHSSGIRPSRFIGTENKISFVALSHIRMYKSVPESEVAKITYELKPDDGTGIGADILREQKDQGLMMLVKTEATNAFDPDEHHDRDFSQSYALLHGIKKLRFRYLSRKDKDRWDSAPAWDSDKEDTKNRFPDIVEVSFEVLGPSHLSFDGVYKFRPEVSPSGLDATF